MQEPLRSNFCTPAMLKIQQELRQAQNAVNHGFSGNERWRDKLSYSRRVNSLEKRFLQLKEESDSLYLVAMQNYAKFLVAQNQAQELRIKNMKEHIEKMVKDIELDENGHEQI